MTMSRSCLNPRHTSNMKRTLFGNKMFIADLLIVSLWALFAWHFAWGGIVTPTMIVLRIALSFMIYRKSRWAFCNALLFAAMYIGIVFNMPYNDLAFDPIIKIAYVFCCLIGYSDWAVKAFDCSNDMPIETALYTFWGLYVSWLILIPILSTWYQKSILPVLRLRKKIWWYIGGVMTFSMYLYFTDRDVMIFAGGLLMSLTPIICRIIYKRRKRSILGSLLQDKILIRYLAIVSVMFGAALIGLFEVNSAKPIAAFLFPIILYVIALRLSNVESVKTVPALMLGISGILQILVYNRFHDTVIMLLTISVVLSCVAVYLTYRQSHSIFSSILLLMVSTLVLPIFLLGYNPYAAIDANEVVSLNDRHKGLYQFRKNGKLGLRDRYGIVVYANYDKYELLGKELYARDYILVYSDVWFWDDFAIENIYDLKNREFIIPDEAPDDLHNVKKTHDKVYAIYNREGKQVYTLCLPSGYESGGSNDLHLIACDSENGENVMLPDDLSDMTITKSDDGKTTLFAYDTGYGGTSPAFSTYIQYESNGQIITDYLNPYSESDYICYSDIQKDGVEAYDGAFTKIVAQIPLSETETGYIIDTYFKASSREGNDEAYLIKYEDGKLKKLPFVSKHGAFGNSVQRDYYIPDWYFTTDGLGWNWVMSFDKETKTLYVPEEGEMVMTDRYDLFQYKDGKMRYIGSDGGFWLHPSVRNVGYLKGIYQTDTKLIRIDRTMDDVNRLTVWTKPKPMSAMPDIILYEDRTEKVDKAIVFKNSDYTYIVPEYRRGQGNDFGKIIIKYKGKVIQETEV